MGKFLREHPFYLAAAVLLIAMMCLWLWLKPPATVGELLQLPEEEPEGIYFTASFWPENQEARASVTGSQEEGGALLGQLAPLSIKSQGRHTAMTAEGGLYAIVFIYEQENEEPHSTRTIYLSRDGYLYTKEGDQYRKHQIQDTATWEEILFNLETLMARKQ